METPSHTIRRTSIPGAAGAAITGTATIGTADMKADMKADMAADMKADMKADMAADMKADMEADTAVEAAVEADMGAAADTLLRLRTLEIQPPWQPHSDCQANGCNYRR
jgi:hypothetical protein